MTLNKRGQGLSINVIIIAALALIVLVVLVLVFTGRIAIFERGVQQEGNAELIRLRTQYGDCHPGITAETTFRTSFNQAESPRDKAEAQAILVDEVNRCAGLLDKAGCLSADCSWQ